MNKTDLCEALPREIGESYTCVDQGNFHVSIHRFYTRMVIA